jgi:hypothetical protein
MLSAGFRIQELEVRSEEKTSDNGLAGASISFNPLGQDVAHKQERKNAVTLKNERTMRECC